MFTFPVAHFSSDGSVSIENSALFDADATNLQRTQGSGNAGVWTWAAWLYKTHSMNQVFLNFGTSGAEGQLGWAATDKMYCYDGATTVFLTTQVFRDQGWYHIHVAYNTGASGSDKVKLSVNGSLVTAFDTDNRSSANDFEDCNTSSQITYVGNNSNTGDGIYFRGYMAQASMVDGSAVAVGSYIETSDDGYVTPKSDDDIKALADAGGVNSYFFDNANSTFDSTSSIIDHSSTGHTLTVGGNVAHSTTETKVNPTSIKFDGSGDYLKWAQSGHADFTFGTGDFCIEGWFLRAGLSGTSNYSYIIDFRYSGNNSDRPAIYMDGSNNIHYDLNNIKITSSTDPSLGSWFHLAVARNSGTTTMYLNGTSVGSFSDSVDYLVGRPWLGEYPQTNSYCINGYMDEVRISKGNARYTANFTPSTTPHTIDSDTVFLVAGIRNYGAGTDASSKSNHMVNSGATVTTYMTPTILPRFFWNPLSPAFAGTLSEGNTKLASSGVHQGAWANTNFPKTGKWQTEVLVTVNGASAIVSFGIMKNLSSESLNQYIQPNSDAYGFYVYPSELPFYSAGTELFDVGAVSRGTYKYQICWDASAGDGTADVYFGINNTFYDNDGSTDGNPATGANPTIENLDISSSEWSLLGIPYDAGSLTTADEADWQYTIQSGYTALTLANIAETLPSESQLSNHLNIQTWAGNATDGRAITTGFDTDFAIIKRTNTTGHWVVADSVRGNGKSLYFQNTDSETTDDGSGHVNTFTDTGVTIDDQARTNASGHNYAGWFLKAGGAPTATNSEAQGAAPTSGSYMIDGVASSANTIGTADITKLSVNTKLGFSCGLYNGSNSDTTLQTGLTNARFVIIKRTNSSSYNWVVRHADLDDDHSLFLNTTAAQANNSYFDSSEDTSQLLHLEGNSNATSIAGGTFIFYAFAESDYISIGSYYNSSGTAFIPTLNKNSLPIRPMLFLAKTYSAGTSNWILLDEEREGYNVDNDPIYPNTNGAEGTTDLADLLSTGVKARADADPFYSTRNSVYLAIGHPIVSKSGLIKQGR